MPKSVTIAIDPKNATITEVASDDDETIVDDESTESTDESTAQAEEPQPTGPAPDSEEAILAGVIKLEDSFGNWGEDIKSLYVQYGRDVSEVTNFKDKGKRLVADGYLLSQIMDAHRKHAPGDYSRSTIMANAESAARLGGTPESENRPNEHVKAYAFTALSLSIPGEGPGDPRRYHAGPIPDDWFGDGTNVSWAHIVVMVPTIDRPQVNDALDAWEFKNDFWEAWVRGVLPALRAGKYTVQQLQALCEAKKKAIAQQAKAERDAGKSKEQLDAEKAASHVAKTEKKLTELGADAVSLATKAAKELGYNKEKLRDLLVSKLIIPAEPKGAERIRAIANEITPGEAKALVQELAKLVKTKDDRPMKVLKTLHSTVIEVVKHAQAESQPATVPVPAKKAG